MKLKLNGYAFFVLAAYNVSAGMACFAQDAALNHLVRPRPGQRRFTGHAAEPPETATQKPATGDARTYLHGLAAGRDKGDGTTA